MDESAIDDANHIPLPEQIDDLVLDVDVEGDHDGPPLPSVGAAPAAPLPLPAIAATTNAEIPMVQNPLVHFEETTTDTNPHVHHQPHHLPQHHPPVPIPVPAVPSPLTTIYGVRRGRNGLQGGIFFLWDDCAPLVENCSESEYQCFSNIQDAAHYVLQGRSHHAVLDCSDERTRTPAALPAKLHEQPPLVAGDGERSPSSSTNNHNKENQQGTTGTVVAPSIAATTCDHHEAGTRTNPSPKRKRPSSTVTAFASAATANGNHHLINLNHKKKRKKSSVGGGKIEKASRYWMISYEELQRFQEKYGHCHATNDVDPKMAKFVREQRHEYRFLMQGKESKMIPDKIDKLQALGFDFQYEALAQAEKEEWDALLREFRVYQKSADTTQQMKQSPQLREWSHTQRTQFQNLQDGKRSTLTPDRIQKLNDAGFVFCPRSNFRNYTWEERIAQLEIYKKDHGHLNIPSSHEELGYWTSNVRRSYKYLQEGKKTGMTEERANQLRAMGFSFLVGKRKTGRVEMKAWDDQFELLREFKTEHGHTVVPQHYPGLGRWVKQQRREFKLMKEGKRTTMSPEKVLKLADIGFVFDAQFRRGSKISANNYTKVGGKLKGEQG